jgi:hypothetical protein
MDYDHGPAPFMTLCLGNFASCLLPFTWFPNRRILQDQIYGPFSPRNGRLGSNRDFGLHESILLLLLSRFVNQQSVDFSPCVLFELMTNIASTPSASRILSLSFLRRFLPSTMGDFMIFRTSQSSTTHFTLSIISSSRIKMFLKFFCTPCRVLRKIFCDFSQLENFQGSQFPCILQWTFSWPPSNLMPFLLIFVIWNYNILGALLAVDSSLRHLIPWPSWRF